MPSVEFPAFRGCPASPAPMLQTTSQWTLFSLCRAGVKLRGYFAWSLLDNWVSCQLAMAALYSMLGAALLLGTLLTKSWLSVLVLCRNGRKDSPNASAFTLWTSPALPSLATPKLLSRGSPSF